MENIDLIINFDLSSSSTYLHRIGRTGRNSKMGLAISLSSPSSCEPYLSHISEFPFQDSQFLENVNQQLRD
jgi:superfamily II DNA/RNA helicase